MPRTKFDKPRYPPVDLLKAVILERKMVMKLNWEEIACAAHMTPPAFRHLVTTKHTDDWRPDVRRNVCRYLGVNMQTTLSVMTEEGEVRID